MLVAIRLVVLVEVMLGVAELLGLEGVEVEFAEVLAALGLAQTFLTIAMHEAELGVDVSQGRLTVSR